MQYDFSQKKGGGNGGPKTASTGGFMPGEIGGLANDMVAASGGKVEGWKKFLKGVYSPNIAPKYNFSGGGGKGKGNGGGGGKNDPKKPDGNPKDTDGGNGGFVPTRPRNMQAMASPYGVMSGVQPGGGVMSGIPMMPQQQQMAAPQMQMPNDGVLAMLRARMGR